MNCYKTHAQQNFPRISLLVIALGLAASSAGIAGETGYWAKSRILIQTRAGLDDSQLNKILARHGGRSSSRMRKINAHIIQLPADADARVAVELLKRNPHIKSAEVDKLIAPEQVGNDTYYSSAWHLPKIQAPTAWDSALGTGVTIAILDSGIDATHPDLQGKLVAGWNMYDNNADTTDVYGHGTKVAGSAAAASNNGVGVTGVAWNAKLMPVRISDTSGYAFYSAIANGIYWAADHGAKVVNISYAVQGSSSVQAAANYLKSKGGLVVNSAGNTGAIDATLANDALISVSATDSADGRASWSSFGPYVDVSAPGAGIWTTARGGGYASVSGTSFASPITAGVVALMMSANPALNPSELENILKTTGVDLGTAGTDQEYGAGRINAAAAVQKAISLIKNTPVADVTAPQAVITSPGVGTVKGVVPVDVSATDNAGVAKVDLFANGTLVASDLTAPYSFSWDSSKLADGPANLVAKAYDAAGNIGSSATLNITVNNAVVIANVPPPPPAEIILDNAEPGVQDGAGGRTFTGTWCKSTFTGYFGANSLNSCGNTADSYRWTPSVATAGSYDVYVWWTSDPNRSSFFVPITVSHAGGNTLKYLNQKTNGGKWVLHGRYNLAAGKTGYVEMKASFGMAGADAVRFVPVTTP